jgi:hypothetical protein
MRNPANRANGIGLDGPAPGSAPSRCGQCRLFRHHCLCDLLPRVETRTRVVVVLHQLEDHKTSNTGRLAHRCLPNSEIVIRGDPERARRAHLARQAAGGGQDQPDLVANGPGTAGPPPHAGVGGHTVRGHLARGAVELSPADRLRPTPPGHAGGHRGGAGYPGRRRAPPAAAGHLRRDGRAVAARAMRWAALSSAGRLAGRGSRHVDLGIQHAGQHGLPL